MSKHRRYARADLQKVISILDDYPGLDDFVEQLAQPVVRDVRTIHQVVQQVSTALSDMANVTGVALQNVGQLDAMKGERPFTTLGQLVPYVDTLQLAESGALLENMIRMLITARRAYTDLQERAPQLKQEYEGLAAQAQELIQQLPEETAAAPAAPQPAEAPATGTGTHTGPAGMQFVYE